MRRFSLVAMTAVAVLVGCQNASQTNAPRTTADVTLTPTDGTSNPDAQGLVLGAQMTYVVGHFATSTFSSLATELSIRTWPELDIVPSATVVDDGVGENPLGTVKLYPSAPLTARWYVVRLASLPTGFTASELPSTPLADGSYVSRFYGGSDPHLRGVQFNGPTGGVLTVVLQFSEPVAVTGDRLTVLSLSQSRNTIACSVGPDPVAGWTMHPVSDWTSLCQGGDASSMMTLNLSSGFQSASGLVPANLPYSENLIIANQTSNGSGQWFDPVFEKQNPL